MQRHFVYMARELYVNSVPDEVRRDRRLGREFSLPWKDGPPSDTWVFLPLVKRRSFLKVPSRRSRNFSGQRLVVLVSDRPWWYTPPNTLPPDPAKTPERQKSKAKTLSTIRAECYLISFFMLCVCILQNSIADFWLFHVLFVSPIPWSWIPLWRYMYRRLPKKSNFSTSISNKIW